MSKLSNNFFLKNAVPNWEANKTPPVIPYVILICSGGSLWAADMRFKSQQDFQCHLYTAA